MSGESEMLISERRGSEGSMHKHWSLMLCELMHSAPCRAGEHLEKHHRDSERWKARESLQTIESVGSLRAN